MTTLYNAIKSAGFEPPNYMSPGKITRFPTNGRLSDRAGWVYVFGDGLGAAFGCNRSKEMHIWQVNQDKSLTKVEQAVLNRKIEKSKQVARIELEQRHNHASKKSSFIWHSSKQIINQSEHPYLIKKKVQPNGARLFVNALVISIYDENKQLINLQFINNDSTKRFLSGGKKKGCFSIIGKLDTSNNILICEGWATGASLYEQTGYFTVIALDAGNLEPVAKVMRRLYPNGHIIIAGDNDVSGVGQKAAIAAAFSVGGKYIIPQTVSHDWNDTLNIMVE